MGKKPWHKQEKRVGNENILNKKVKKFCSNQ
jgi:hypothetical protein